MRVEEREVIKKETGRREEREEEGKGKKDYEGIGGKKLASVDHG